MPRSVTLAIAVTQLLSVDERESHALDLHSAGPFSAPPRLRVNPISFADTTRPCLEETS